MADAVALSARYHVVNFIVGTFKLDPSAGRDLFIIPYRVSDAVAFVTNSEREGRR